MEFVEVMKQYRRMCRAHHDCVGCPLEERENMEWTCGSSDLDNEEAYITWERIVMNWARDYPEPVYPTIRELINYIMNKIPGESVSYETRIPANIAKEFNILPINEGRFTKKEK